MAQKDDKLVYPPGVRDITEDISTDDLVRRLKDCAQAYQSMSQEDDNSKYIPLALHLASETFLEHPSRDIRLLVACCIADVFRVYAPDAPYKDMNQLKVIFEFFVDQLRGLEDPSKPSFKRYFYLLENFSCVKTFNICVEIEDNQKILIRLFKLMFRIINENHSVKVKKFMLDMLSPLISEADVVSQELLDVILGQIIEPVKSQNRNSCSLAQDILKRNISSLEPYIQAFFNNALILGKTLQSDVARHLYELIYELNRICPSMLVVVLPQLEFKLKSNEEKERLDVTRILARMFSDQNSTMIEENKTLWSCFLARFNDISPHVRIRCVQYSKQFLLNHPEAKDDITEQLKQRHRDVDENVRYEVVLAILSTAKENFSAISEELLSFVKERTLDKKFKIRKEALLGLAMLYKQHIRGSDLTPTDIDSISWIKNKVLHAYYQTSLEDRFLVERILHTCIVPYQKPMEERMKLLYQLFCSVDDYAVKAFKEIMKCQSVLRTQVRSILEVIQCEKNDNRQKTVATKVSLLSKNLQDPSKSNEYILKFCGDLESNLKLRTMMAQILNGNISCGEAEAKVKEVLKSLGHPVQTNTYYMIIKQLLERIAPVMVDKEGIRHLVECVKDALLGDCSIESELGLANSSHRGLELLWVLTFVFPTAFHDEHIYNNLLLFLNVEDEISADMTLQIFMNISNEMEMSYPDFSAKLLPILENFVETGTAKQAKHAVYCINSIVCDKEKVFGNIIENLKKHFTLTSQYFRTALVSVGHIAYLCHDMFAADFKIIVAKIVVKDLLMLDQDLPRGGEETWGPLDSLPDETKVKIEGMKVMVRWLTGLKDMVQPAMSTLRLLTTVILHDGDLMERQHTAPIENSWMRLSAATCMLKLCQEPNYVNVITLDQFQVLAYVLNDKCPEVKDRFAQKVHKGLFTLKLPLEFLAIFALGALDERKEFRAQVKNYLIVNINKRKEYVKQRVLSSDKLRAFLPDYALPYAVHLLAHAPVLKTYDDVSALIKVKECLWLLMEPLMIKNENYSFSFFKRLLENIKQTKDKQAPDDINMNMKLYAVCDLALSIVMSKTTNFVLKEFPVEPALPSKLFTDTDPSYSNLKTYLPPELICDKPLKSGFEIDLFGSTKDAPAALHNEASVMNDTSVDISHPEHDVSKKTKINEGVMEVESESVIVKTKFRTKKGSAEKDLETYEHLPSEQVNESDSSSGEQSTDTVLRTFKTRSTAKAKMSADTGEKQVIFKEKLSNAKGKISNAKVKNSREKVSETKEKLNAKEKISEMKGKQNEKEKVSEVKEKQCQKEKNTARDKSVNKPIVQQRPIRSSRSSVSSSLKSSDSSEYGSSGRQNGMLPPNMNSGSVSPDVQSSLKECNVSLTKGEVERYIALSNSIIDSNDENSMSDSDFQNNSMSQNISGKGDTPIALTKRKRDDSSASRSVRSRVSSRSSDRQVNSTPSPSKDKTVLKSKTNLSQCQSFPKNNSVKKDTKMQLVNGNRGSRISSKESTPQKASPKLPPKRNQRNLIRTNLRKR